MQRVAIARALLMQPALLLADEPTGNLDSRSAADVLALIEEVHGSGQTVVLVTHDSDVAARAQRQVHLRDGRIELDRAA
jgi:putative ABC transport system ATP-binding protein